MALDPASLFVSIDLNPTRFDRTRPFVNLARNKLAVLAEPAGFVPPNPAVASGGVSGLLALFALQKLKQLVVRAECSYDVMDQEQEDNHAGAS